MFSLLNATNSYLRVIDISTGNKLSFQRFWHLSLKVLSQMCHEILRKAFHLETEKHEDTKIPDEETVQPIEEASTEEVIAPAVASDISNRFYARGWLVLRKPL